MGDKKKEEAIRNFVDAMAKKDVDRAMTFFTPDAVWTNTEGVFTGTEELRKYTEWMVNNLTDLTFNDMGMGIVVEGTNAVYQYSMEGTYEGKRIKAPGVCTYQFEGDKCKNHFTVVDRLSMASQASGGAFAGMAVNAIVKRMEKGLR